MKKIESFNIKKKCDRNKNYFNNSERDENNFVGKNNKYRYFQYIIDKF